MNKSFKKTQVGDGDFFVPKDSELLGFSKFGIQFQEILCKVILSDRAFADQISEVLNPNFLELKYLQAFVKLIFDYKDQFRVHPTVDIMDSLILSQSMGLGNYPDNVVKQLTEYFKRISIQDVATSVEYVKKTSLDFCRKQKVKEAMISSVKLLNEASFDDISKILNDALKSGSENNFGTDYIVDFEKRYLLTTRSPITSGWEELDKITQGGYGKGELVVFIASSGKGKSHLLVHAGVEALKLGKSVVHYTMELSEEFIGKRYDASNTGFKIDDLSSVKAEVFDMIKEVPGKLLIKQYPAKVVSTTTIRNHLEKIISRGFKPDMIIVDYGDLLKPPGSKVQEKRFNLEETFEDLRAIAIDYQVPVITASQTQRGTAEEEVVTMESIAEAWSKCWIADLIISLSRTRKDLPLGGRIFVAKNRNGIDNVIFPVYMDTATTTIRVLPSVEEDTVENVLRKSEVNKSKEQLQVLLKTYKNLKEKQKT